MIDHIIILGKIFRKVKLLVTLIKHLIETILFNLVAITGFLFQWIVVDNARGKKL